MNTEGKFLVLQPLNDMEYVIITSTDSVEDIDIRYTTIPVDNIIPMAEALEQAQTIIKCLLAGKPVKCLDEHLAYFESLTNSVK
jgi:hypothetical protein